MDLCVHFGKPAFIVFISSLYLYFGFSNKQLSIQLNSTFQQFRREGLILCSKTRSEQPEQLNRSCFRSEQNVAVLCRQSE